MGVVHVRYYTDPACPWSWAAEPGVRRLMVEFGDEVRFTYVMVGMAREFRGRHEPTRMALSALDAAAASGMPVDSRLWLDAPPRSSYPACLAVKAAAEQDLDGPYLRRLREGLMCDRLALDSTDALVAAARTVDGMDVDRFAIDLASNAIVEALGADFQRAREPSPVRAPHDASGEPPRVRTPSFEIRRDAGDHGEVVGVIDGSGDVAALRAAVLEAGATPSPGGLPDALAALRRFGRMAAAEVAAVCDLPGPRASAELWRLALEWRARPERAGAGELWRPA
jgi:predicted DsbA family dithiol-disulfide isomerase